MLREEHDKTSISLTAASARLKEISTLGLDIEHIEEVFNAAQREFTAGNYSMSLDLTKDTIAISKQFYKEYSLPGKGA